MIQGNDFSFIFTVENAVDLTTAQRIKWAMFEPAGTVPLVTKSPSVVIGNVFRIEIDRADTLELAPGSYYHEVEIRDENGKTSTVFASYFMLQDSRIVN